MRPPALCDCTQGGFARAAKIHGPETQEAPLKIRWLTIVLAVPLTLAGASASAGGPSDPEVVDPAGDANLVNNQGQEAAPEQNLSTAPASIDGADIRSIWLETLYSTVKERDADGAVRFVRHVPHSLRINFVTTAPAKPTFGPGVIFRMSANVGEGGCQVQFQVYLAGTATAMERAEINRLRNCTGGNGILGGGFTHAVQGTTLSLTFPFAQTEGMLTGVETLSAYTRPHTRVVLPNAAATAPAIDQTAPIRSFTLGSDVPPDVDCTTEPGHPDCA